MQEGGAEMLDERGLSLDGYMLRQFNLRDFGIPDLLTFDINEFGILEVEIIELKKGTIDFTTLEQCFRYKMGVRQMFIDVYSWQNEHLDEASFKITLIGSRCSEMLGFARKFLNEDIRVFTYCFNAFEGLHFNEVHHIGYKSGAMNCGEMPIDLVAALGSVGQETTDAWFETLAKLEMTRKNK